MSVARRLFKILRAQVAARAGSRETSRSSAGWEAEVGSPGVGNSSSDPVQDPELARYYANLELPYGAGFTQVKEARKRLMRRYHPDLHSQDPERQKIATELVKGLNHAYEKLRARLEKAG